MPQPDTSPPLPTAPGPSSAEPPAGFWIRAAGAAIDVLILKLATTVLGVPVWLVGIRLPLGSGLLRPFALLVYALQIALVAFYFAAAESGRSQGTIGKRLLGLAVTGRDGERIGLERALVRTAAKILSALPLWMGFVAAAFTRDHRALHDFVASTHVVRRRPATVLGVVVGVLAAAILGGRVVAPPVRDALGALERRSQRAKAAEEVAGALAAIHAGELAHLRREGQYLDFRVPSVGVPQTHPLRWSGEDVAVSKQLAWNFPERTMFSYTVTTGFAPGNAYGAGPPTFSACAMSDLDGDRSFALVVLFQPGMNAAGEIVGPPPPAPCEVVQPNLLARPLEMQPGDPVGVPVRVTRSGVW